MNNLSVTPAMEIFY